jgi:hypothetical protein
MDMTDLQEAEAQESGHWSIAGEVARWGNWPEGGVSVDDSGGVWTGDRWLTEDEVGEFVAWLKTQETELELAQNVYDVMQRAARGELAVAFLAARGELADAPDDYQIAAAAVVEMCRQAFTGELETEQ